MIRVLQVLQGGDEFGGVETFVYQYYSHLDRTKTHFDFAFCYGDTMKDRWDDPVLKDSQHMVLNISGRNMFQLYRSLRACLRSGHYDCIHVNTGNLSIQVPAQIAAKREGVKIRIAHSHSIGSRNGRNPIRDCITKVLQHLIVDNATKLVACSVEAGEHLYGADAAKNRTQIIPNAIDIGEFAYDETLRQKKREELGLEGHKTYIQVGNLQPVKNHEFTLEVFKSVMAREKDSILLLAGTGMLEASLKEMVMAGHMEANVRFLGYRTDVNELLQTADIMLMPSKWEGFPIAVIEAQVSGTTVLCSDNIPRSVDVTGRCEFLPLEAKRWEEACLAAVPRKEDLSWKIRENGFDVDTATERFAALYTG